MVKNIIWIYCGGVLINREWIVMGVYCVIYWNVLILLVVFGEYDVIRNEGIEIFWEVDIFYMYFNYYLLMVDFDFVFVCFKFVLDWFSRFIFFVCLLIVDDSFYVGINCIVIGFGWFIEVGSIVIML